MGQMKIKFFEDSYYTSIASFAYNVIVCRNSPAFTFCGMFLPKA